MGNTVLLEKQEEVFTRYSEQVQNFFLKKEVVINLYPNDIVSEQESENTTLKVTSAEQYCDYLDTEIDFWKQNDPNKKLEDIVHYSRLNNAKYHFDNALKYVNSPASMTNYLNQSIGAISTGALSSKTNLAKEVLKHVEKSSNFLSGFKSGMLISSSSTISTYPDVLQGFYAAMIYRNIFNSYAISTKENINEFKTNVEKATNNYSTLNKKYTISFLEHEKRLREFKEETNNQFRNFFEKEKSFFNSASDKLTTLEKQYQENLKLKAPAQYWKEMEQDYIKKGRFWLSISAVISFITIALLVGILLFAPDAFSKDNNWFETIKNSAIVTVMTSICIYILRTTVKIAMSSFHLSRDAKERNKLSYFYLSLIEDDAVTDKERAIILNALFSRSDTGLLKGDTSPTMTNNVSDLIEVVKNAKS